jgi:hypothetical protein
MEALSSSETSVRTRTTRRNIPEVTTPRVQHTRYAITNGGICEETCSLNLQECLVLSAKHFSLQLSGEQIRGSLLPARQTSAVETWRVSSL